MNKDQAYWDWIASEADRTHSDGCTGVSEWHQRCCFQHDLGCLFGKDPFSAYLAWLAGSPDPWLDAKDLSRREVDIMFGECNFQASGKNPGGWIRSGIRFLGVRLGALLGIGVRKANQG